MSFQNKSADDSNVLSEARRIEQLEKEVRRLKSAVEELSVLNELAIAAGSSLEFEKMLDIIVQKSVKALRAEQGSILLVTDQQDSPLKTLVRQADQSRSRIFNYRLGTNITGWVLKYQQPLIIENLATDTRFQASEQERREIHTVLCVPIYHKGRIIGVLTITNKRSNEAFNENDLRLASIIAAQSGQLIRNSQLQQETIEKKRMEQELVLAQKIQRGLLPEKVPQIPQLEIASYFNPAEEVGGDYYDYFIFDEHRCGIVIADVSGHGASAAMMMTMVKGILHSLVFKFQSPRQMLDEVNQIISKISPRDMFITMMYMVFDLENKKLVYSNAGHNPVLQYDNTAGECRFAELRGCALNLTGTATYTDREIPLNPGDIFLIYTDGITEAANESNEMFEEHRLLEAMQSVTDKSAAEIIQHLVTEMHAFTGNIRQADDIAMIAIKINT